jgi:uncharacterized protein
MKTERLQKLENLVKEYLKSKNQQSPAHRFDHAKRVMIRALHLAEAYGGDKELVAAAALLHDVEETYDAKDGHAERSAQKAEEFLREAGFNQLETEKIKELIKSHSSEDDVDAQSIEAKILFDADKLDGIGAIGIARVFMYAGKLGMGVGEAVEWYRSKIEKARKRLYTEEARKIAEENLKFVEWFLKELEGELDEI